MIHPLDYWGTASCQPEAARDKVRAVCEFIKANGEAYDITTMCRALEVTGSGFQAWLQKTLFGTLASYGVSAGTGAPPGKV